MGLLAFIILGGIAGYLASVVMGTNARQGMVTDILLGIVGAFVGGFLMNTFGQGGVSGFNLYSLLVSVLGAVAVIYVGRLLRS